MAHGIFRLAAFTVLAGALIVWRPGDGVAADTIRESIMDPAVGMPAFDVTLPAGWRYQGTFFPGDSCSQIPFAVFRAASPDGAMEVRQEPRFDWIATNNPQAMRQNADCLPIQQPLTAADFLKYLSGIEQVAYVGEMALPQGAIDRQQQAIAQQNAALSRQAGNFGFQPAFAHGDMAAARVTYRQGSAIMEAQLAATVGCFHTFFPPNQNRIFTEKCTASVREVRAPQGRLESTLALIEANRVGAFPNAQWISAYLQDQAQRGQAMVNGAFARNNQIMAARQQQFNQAQAVQQQQHEQFLATMQRGTDQALARGREAMNARSTASSDWVDYSLDRHTVAGSNGTAHVSNDYTNTWSNGQGAYYSNNEPNAGPNGVLPGNWQLNQRVHGNGQPY